MLASVSRASSAKRNSRARVRKSLLGVVIGVHDFSQCPMRGKGAGGLLPCPTRNVFPCSGGLANALEQDGGNVALTGIGKHGDDGFASKFRQLGQANRNGRSR